MRDPRRLEVLVGTREGAAYDRYARLVADRMAEPLGVEAVEVHNHPGDPVQHMALLSATTPADAFRLVMVRPGLYLRPLVREPLPTPWERVHWVGTPTTSHYLLYGRTGSAAGSLEAMLRSDVATARCGAVDGMTTGRFVPAMLQEVLGIGLEVVAGYREGPEVDAAVARGDVDCRVLTIDGFHSHEPYPTWLEEGRIRVLLQTGPGDPRLGEVPTLERSLAGTLATGNRRLVEFLLAASTFGRPLAAPNDADPERVDVLRAAFDVAVGSPEAHVSAAARDLRLDPVPGRELRALAVRLAQLPRRLAERARAILT